MSASTRVEPLWDLSTVPGWLIAVVLIGGISLFLTVLYYLICGVTALRGWSSYAARHRGPAEFPPDAQVFGNNSMMIGGNIAPANYRHVIGVALSDAGIHLRMGSMFRAFHPPLLVPWRAVQDVTRTKAIVGEYTAVECQGLPRLVFFKGLGDAVFARWRGLKSLRETA